MRLIPLLLLLFQTQVFAETRNEIDRVEILGVTILTPAELDSVVEIASGDPFDKAKIFQTVEQIQAAYRAKGHEQVKIEVTQSREKNKKGILDRILRINIKEGIPTKIAFIRLVSGDAFDPAHEKVWKKYEQRIQREFTLKENDTFDQRRLAETKKLIQDYLVSEEYVGVRVEHKKLPVDSLTPDKSEAKWVGLEFQVFLGDRVTFGFRGNSVFTHIQLSNMVEEQRLIGFGKDYVGAIRGRILEAYRGMGYASADVQFTTQEQPTEHRRHITYLISEGRRVEIEEIEFDGNSVFTTAELKAQLYRNFTPVVNNGYYVEKDFRKATDLLFEWMQSRGYLSSKLVSINTVFSKVKKSSEETEKVKLVVYIYEGEQTLFGSLNIKGMTVFTLDQAKEILNLKTNEPLNLFTFSEGLESLKKIYRDRGYLNMVIVNEDSENLVQYSEENRVADVYLEIAESYEYRVSNIIVEGLAQTDENIVTRELTFKIGDVLTETKINESEEALRKLGIFSGVIVRAIDDEKVAFKVVRIQLQEGTPGVIAGGVGFRSDLGIRVFGRAAYSNVGGKNHVAFVNLNANRRFFRFHFAEYQSQIGYMWPYFMGLEKLTFRPTFTVSGTQYIQFDATTISAALTWERKILTKPNLTAIFSYTLERIIQFNAQSAVDNQGLRIGTIGPSIRLDMRNNPLAPTSGLFAVASFELAEPWLFSQTAPYRIGYYRYQFRGDYFLELIKNMTWFFSFRTGFEKNLEIGIDNGSGGRVDPESGEPVNGIPLIKQFALGGVGSLRGFLEQEINRRNQAILGTLFYVNYRTQLDMPLIGSLRFGPFLDAGNVLADQISFGNLRWGAGFGFHYLTPVGPVNLDWGYNLFPQPGDLGLNQFYLSIGVI